MHDDHISQEHAKLSWIWLSLVVLVLDQLTKYLVLGHFELHVPHPVLPVLNLYLTYNRGAAFSFLSEHPIMAYWGLSVITIVLSAGLLVWMYRLPKKSTWLSVSFALILGGALGNLLDRLRFGFVVDFISFHLGSWYFAIFNVADIAICIGAAMIAGHIFWLSSKEKKGEV